MNKENMQLNIIAELEKAKNCTSQAQVLFDNNFYDGAISRAYYAIFHYAKALLFSAGFEPKTHAGLVHLFNLHFIKNGRFDKRFSTILSHAQKAREESDYFPEIPFTKEEAEERLREVETFGQQILTSLTQAGYKVRK